MKTFAEWDDIVDRLWLECRANEFDENLELENISLARYGFIWLSTGPKIIEVESFPAKPAVLFIPSLKICLYVSIWGLYFARIFHFQYELTVSMIYSPATKLQLYEQDRKELCDWLATQ